MSWVESRVSGCSSVHGPGILPSVTSLHETVKSIRCCSGEYAAQSEKLTAFRPSYTALAISQETGATWVYHGHTVWFE
jgi:hypothetical protein